MLSTLRCARFLLLALAAMLAAPGAALAQDARLTDNRSYPGGGTATLGVSGRTSGAGVHEAFLRFDVSTLPSGVAPGDVAKATLVIYTSTVTHAGAFDVSLVTSAWSQASAAPPSFSGTPLVSNVPVTAENAFIVVDLTATVRSWLAGTTTNDGIALTASAGTPTFEAAFDSKENARTSHEARLEVSLSPNAELASLQAQITALQAALAQEVANRQAAVLSEATTRAAADATTLSTAEAFATNAVAGESTARTTAVTTLQTSVTTLGTTVSGLATELAPVSLVTDANTGKPTIRFSGVNVQVVSGSGLNNDNGALTGLGNLIVGYNESRSHTNGTDVRTGSNNLIVGGQQNYASYGGFVAGEDNTISGPFASVSGGQDNSASGGQSSVSGGSGNAASGQFSSVSGGASSTASGDGSSVSGGVANTASGALSAVSGGERQSAPTEFAVAAPDGGLTSTVSGLSSMVSGLSTTVGGLTTELAPVSLVTDANTGKPTIRFSGVNVQVVSGSGANDDGGSLTGLGNLIVGYNAVRSPNGIDKRQGSNNLIVGDQQNYTSYGGFVAGGFNAISGAYASVGGGQENAASGDFSSVSGGEQLSAATQFAVAAADAGLTSIVSSLTTRLAPVSLVTDANTGKPTIRFSGVNVQVVSGSGSNDDDGALTGLGNLIVGYNAVRSPNGIDKRLGSNNLIVGDQQNYTSYGGFVAGAFNTVSGAYASVSGGQVNTASGYVSSVSGGDQNLASGDFSSVSGGNIGTASGSASSVSGGNGNAASGDTASVSGGDSNTAGGRSAAVSGGQQQSAATPFAVAAPDGGLTSAVFGLSATVSTMSSTVSGLSTMVATVSALSSTVSGLSTTVAALSATVSGLSPVSVSGLAATVSELSSTVSGLSTTVGGLTATLAPVSLVTDAITGQPTLLVSGVNVQIVSGSGSTDDGTNGGTPANSSFTGRGNLIIGYNELRNDPDTSDPDVRTGSHNLVVGQWQNYASYGGFLAGEWNAIAATAPNATVSGGTVNTASAEASSVSGGEFNTASGFVSSVTAGRNNTASGDSASVSGGAQNTASGAVASVSAGNFNVASNNYSSVSGGRNNLAIGDSASISGGGANIADGLDSSVSGGFQNATSNNFASVSGGRNNKATGDSASVSGGNGVTESTDGGWAAGTLQSGPTQFAVAAPDGGLTSTVSGANAVNATASSAFSSALVELFAFIAPFQ